MSGSRTVRLANDPSAAERPMQPYGDALWRAVFESDEPVASADAVIVCATDRAGNEACLP